MKLHFSFIIPVYNRPDEIQELLQSFLALETLEDYEIIIVDNNDNELKLIRFDNLLIRENQTTFSDIINNNYSESLIIDQVATDSLELIAAEAESTERLTNVNHSYNAIAPSDTGFIGSSGFTEKYNVNHLVYYEVHDLYVEAARREKRLKNWQRKWKIELIEKSNPFIHFLHFF